MRFAARARKAAQLRGTVSIMLESNERMRALNRCFRKVDKPTDVLSFPPAHGFAQLHSGDIAISAEIAIANARDLGHSPADEVKTLILHGMLHLAGYDHETDSGTMARKEKKLRSQLGLRDSLIERAHSAPRPGRPRKRAARRGKTDRIDVAVRGPVRSPRTKPVSAGKVKQTR